MDMTKSEAPMDVALITTVVGMQMPSGWVKVKVGSGRSRTVNG